MSGHATTLTPICVADCDDEYLDTVIRKWDKDGSGSVDFGEFETMCALLTAACPARRALSSDVHGVGIRWSFIAPAMTKRQMRFRVLKPGVIKRGFEKESAQIGSLEVGSVIEALERRGNRVQAQITDTQTGWVSVISQKGAVIIEEIIGEPEPEPEPEPEASPTKSEDDEEESEAEWRRRTGRDVEAVAYGNE